MGPAFLDASFDGIILNAKFWFKGGLLWKNNLQTNLKVNFQKQPSKPTRLMMVS